VQRSVGTDDFVPVLCVLVPAFRLGVARLKDPSLDPDAPVLVADKHERGRVIECTAAAAALGARVGMTVVQAQAAARDARVIVDDAARDRAVWNAILDALDAASPLVDDAALGCAYLEMHGIPGGEAGWFAAARAALAAFALPFALGLGPNRFVARAVALVAPGTACDARAAEALLAPLPLGFLDIDGGTIDRLHVLGVRTLGDLRALPHGPFVRRFGPDAAHWHARAHGIDPEPLRPRPRATRIDRTLYGEGTAASEEAVLFALRTLIGRIVDDLVAAGKRCGRLVLALECEDGEVVEITTRVAQPTAQPATLFELLRARIEGVVLRTPVTGARLVAEQLEDGGVQIALFSGNDPDPDALAIALARLDAAVGEGIAARARVTDGARFEERFVLEPFVLGEFGNAPPVALPITATLQYRPHDPRPIAVRVRRGRPHAVGTPPRTVLDVAGPWRVDTHWWAEATGDGTHLIRDEYDVLLDDGALLRLGREAEQWSLRGRYD
jgi:nucleotidyltransferase/DNA polymerase involved in DNA repair